MTTPSAELHALPMPALARLLDEIGVGARHAPRVFQGLHRDGVPLDRIGQLGRHTARIAAATTPTAATFDAVHDNPDETRKLVVRFADGARVESVLVPMRDDRYTLCVSSQVGCAMACAFCATGTLGLTRSLTAGEIVAQVHLARALVADERRRVSRLVFMGMGEPLAAYDAVLDAIRILLDPHGPCFGAKNITVSTVGLVPRIAQLAADTGGRIQLALSLHAGTDATRARIVPIARRWPIAELRAALEAWPLPGSRALMVEVVALPGVNDGPADLDGIADFMRGLRGVVNVIPFNPFPSAPFRSPTDAEVLAMHRALSARGVLAKIRWPRGRGVAGACGQLMLAEPVAD
jgi:23S rRNA (adenine2503-C2)-methyltransferase